MFTVNNPRQRRNPAFLGLAAAEAVAGAFQRAGGQRAAEVPWDRIVEIVTSGLGFIKTLGIEER